ncbi:MAG: DUF4129 domain-containing protein [Polyangiaceae bacterium]|nr:DUF4129 domain-containing protein [Polyangiaceae bacterium]
MTGSGRGDGSVGPERGDRARRGPRAAARDRAARPRDPARPRETTRRAPEPATTPSAGVFDLILKVLLGVAIALVIVFIASSLMRPGPPAEAEGVAEPGGPAPPRPLPQPSEIEALAAAGRYTEAIHAMLLLSVAHLSRRGVLTLSDDMTGREALRGVSGDEALRRALGELVLAVEISLFGGRELGRDDYERCAAAFRRITAEPAAGASAAAAAPPPGGGA